MRSRRLAVVLTGCSLIAGLLAAPPVTVAGALTAASPAASQTRSDPWAGSFMPVDGNPVRVLDTRIGLGGGGGAVAPKHTVTASISGPGGRPAAVIKVTVPGNAPSGSLSVYPSGTTWNGHVSISLVGGSTISQQLHVKLGADGGVTIRNNSATSVHLIVDLLGYYSQGTPSQSGTFAALDSRILDTRAGSPIAPGRKLTLTLPGHGGIPAAGASAVVLNIAVLSARANGLLSVTDGDGSQATVHLRFAGNQSMQTERVVNVGSDGKLIFSQSSAAGVHLVIDLMGYYLPGNDVPIPGTPARYHPITPRPLPTRQGTTFDTQLRLNQHQPLALYPPDFGDGTVAYNIVISPDQPGQPTLLGLYDSGSGWNPTVTLSSTPARQPTELIVHQNVEGYPTLVNLSSAQTTYLHAYVTGYYWYGTCVYC